MDLSTGIWIHAGGERIPCAPIRPSAMVIMKGTEPTVWEFTVDDPGKFDELNESKVDIEFTAPDQSGDQESFKIEGWYLVQVFSSAPGLWNVIIADPRWQARQTTLEHEFNVYVAGSGDRQTIRPQSLNPQTNAPWTCFDAAVFAIAQYGLEFEDDIDFPADLKTVVLPRNLGNNIGGGYFGGDWDHVMAQFLEPINCAPLPLPNGKMTITDRSTVHSDDLHTFAQSEGVVGTIKRYDRPKKIRIKFQNRLERWAYVDETPTPATAPFDPDAVAPTAFGEIGIENVIPYTFGSDPKGHVNLFVEALEVGGLTQALIRSRFMYPRMVVIHQNDSDAVVQRKDRLDYYLHQFFRILFRMNFDHGDAGMADIQMGHLGIDGMTASEKSCYMPYTQAYSYERLRFVNKPGNPLDTRRSEYTTSYELDMANPAPWIPRVFMDGTGEYIIYLESQDTNRFMANIPGTLEHRGVGAGDELELSVGDELPTWRRAKIRAGWRMVLFYHGLMVSPRPDLGFAKPYTEIEAEMFADGHVDYIDYPVKDLTANYAHLLPRNDASYAEFSSLSAAQLKPVPFNPLIPPPMQSINAGILTEHRDFIVDQVKRYFSEGKAGIPTTVGISALRAGKWPRGSIHSLSIVLGGKRDFTIECQWVIQPDVIPVYTGDERKRFQGEPVRVIG